MNIDTGTLTEEEREFLRKMQRRREERKAARLDAGKVVLEPNVSRVPAKSSFFG